LARSTLHGVRFIYRYEHPETKKQVELAIGHLGDVTLAEAWESWEELRAQRMAGKVPALAEQASAASMPTRGVLAKLYLDDYASKVKRSWKDDERLLKRHILPDCGDMPADQFTTELARELFNSLNRTPRERDKLRAVLSALFNVAVGKTSKIPITESCSRPISTIPSRTRPRSSTKPRSTSPSPRKRGPTTRTWPPSTCATTTGTRSPSSS
jgi:hypothetical protein